MSTLSGWTYALHLLDYMTNLSDVKCLVPSEKSAEIETKIAMKLLKPDASFWII